MKMMQEQQLTQSQQLLPVMTPVNSHLLASEVSEAEIDRIFTTLPWCFYVVKAFGAGTINRFEWRASYADKLKAIKLAKETNAS